MLILALFLAAISTQYIQGATMSGGKTLYLIRHAESYENKLIHSFKTLIGVFPKDPSSPREPLLPLLGILNVPYLIDCPLSPAGVVQTENLQSWSSSTSFLPSLSSKSPVLIVHSPLQRARRTCLAATGYVTPSSRNNSEDPTLNGSNPGLPNVRVEESQLMIEKTPIEWLPGLGGRLDTRLTDFKNWVSNVPEDTVVVVGHSQWFKKLLGMSFKFDNCDVWKVEVDGEGGWGGASRLYKGNEVEEVVVEKEGVEEK
ncbi:hypothetical protein TrST_g8847 [Triparma strigata]|uniref:Phosphoglycerate mutase-like protein n=1 Tax=Triparma strigata TaxID=1606541 RepID=A0A9W7A904_9STRA|nr:hypothetical protein TrST_g8847 [Triparma strigata]